MRAYFDYRSPGLAAELLGLDLTPQKITFARLRQRAMSGKSTRNPPSVTSDGSQLCKAALARASFGKPISRAPAERHFAQVVERAATYNADPSHLLTVKEIALFGSYLDPDADQLGDLDLAVTVVRRETDGERYVESRPGIREGERP